MPKLIPRLTEFQIKNAKPRETDYKLYDAGGLRLLVRKSGKKVWQYPFTLNGRANIHTLGQYPDVTIAQAREMLLGIKKLIKDGVNPNHVLQSDDTNVDTFEKVAREWHGKQVWAEKHASNILRTLERDAFPVFGEKNISDINRAAIVAMLRKVEERNAVNVAKRLNQYCSAVFDYAINLGLCENNPASGKVTFLQARTVQHRPHLQAAQLKDFLINLNNYRGGSIVRLALHILLLTFVRPGELRNARWDEFDFNECIWKIPAHRMKMRRAHLVPLSPQVISLLNQLQQLTGKVPLLFPSARTSLKPISDVTLLKAIQIMGYVGEKKIVPHGFRATASTILNESGLFRHDVIERQLAHMPKDKIRGAYNHAEYLTERRNMMTWWSNYLEERRP